MVGTRATREPGDAAAGNQAATIRNECQRASVPLSSRPAGGSSPDCASSALVTRREQKPMGPPTRPWPRVPLLKRARHLLAEALEIETAQLHGLELGMGDWIDRLAVVQDLEMQVRAGRVAGAADEAD